TARSPLSLHDALPIWLRAGRRVRVRPRPPSPRAPAGAAGGPRRLTRSGAGPGRGLVRHGAPEERRRRDGLAVRFGRGAFRAAGRSEEHTSELQSLAYL